MFTTFLSLFLVFIILGSSLSFASDIYVSNEGNDLWDGQSSVWNGTSGPKATIKNAVSTANTGSNVYISNGTYNETNISITKNMSIIGQNPDTTIIDAKKTGKIFTIAQNIAVSISNLTLTNAFNGNSHGGAIATSGDLNVSNVIFTNNHANSFGGAIYTSLNAKLNVNNSTFKNNTAKNNGGAIYTTSYGIWSNIAPQISISNINNSVFIDNHAGFNGGAVYIDSGYVKNLTAVMTILNSTFLNNNGSIYGGAIATADGVNLTVNDSILINNSAATGGAIFADSRCVSNISNTLFKNNNASSSGGAFLHNINSISNMFNNTFISNNAFYSGGALENGLGSIINISSSIFDKNIARHGVAIYNGFKTSGYNESIISLTNSTLTNNSNAKGYGMGIYNGGNLTAWFNRIVDNGVFQVYNANDSNNNAGSSIINYNWWGVNNPNNNPFYKSWNDIGNFNADSWFIFNISADKTSLKINESSNATVNILYDNNGNLIFPGDDKVPFILPVYFNQTLGSVNPIVNILNNATTSTIYTANQLGVGSVTGTLDHQPVTAWFNINKTPTITIVKNETGYAGDNITFDVFVTDDEGLNLLNGKLNLSVGGIELGTFDVINGSVKFNWTIPSDWRGLYDISANYLGTDVYFNSSNNALLKVLIKQTNNTTNENSSNPINNTTPENSSNPDDNTNNNPLIPNNNTNFSDLNKKDNLNSINMKNTGLPIFIMLLLLIPILIYKKKQSK